MPQLQLVWVCAQHFASVMGTNHSKNFYTHTHSTAQHRLRPDLSWGNKAKDFPPVSSRGCLARERESEREGAKGVHKCMAHSSFQFIFLYFCHFLFHYVSSRASNVLSYLPSAIFWLFALFFVFLYFYSRNCHFQCLNLGCLPCAFPCPAGNHKGLAKSSPEKRENIFEGAEKVRLTEGQADFI